MRDFELTCRLNTSFTYRVKYSAIFYFRNKVNFLWFYKLCVLQLNMNDTYSNSEGRYRSVISSEDLDLSQSGSSSVESCQKLHQANFIVSVKKKCFRIVEYKIHNFKTIT